MLGNDDRLLLDRELVAIEPDAFSINRLPTNGLSTSLRADAFNDTDIEDSNSSDEEQEDIFVRIHRAWLNERAAPEVLPYPESETTEMRELLDNQVSSAIEFFIVQTMA